MLQTRMSSSFTSKPLTHPATSAWSCQPSGGSQIVQPENELAENCPCTGPVRPAIHYHASCMLDSVWREKLTLQEARSNFHYASSRLKCKFYLPHIIKHACQACMIVFSQPNILQVNHKQSKVYIGCNVNNYTAATVTTII